MFEKIGNKKNNKNLSLRQKRTFKRKLTYESNKPDKDYGNACQQLDLDKDELATEKRLFLESMDRTYKELQVLEMCTTCKQIALSGDKKEENY